MKEHSILWAYSKICRFEYIRGEAPAVFIPALITSASFQSLTAPAVLEGIAVFALLYVTGFMVNALTDRELDLKYDSFKREIGEATNFLGVRKVQAILAGHIIVASALALHLAFSLGALWLFFLVEAGVFLALAYSLPPFHLKVKGVAAHAVSLALSAFTIPFLFLYFVAAGTIDTFGWMIAASFTLTHYGLTYTNQAFDFDLDLKEGVLTPPVRLGLSRSLWASWAMVAAGLPLLAFSLVSLALSRDTLSALLGPGERLGFALLGSGILTLGYSVPLRALARMIAISREAEDESAAVPAIRKTLDYSKLHASGIASLALFGIILFAASLQTAVVVQQEATQALAFEGVDYDLETASPEGPHADLHIAVRNTGERALPPLIAFVRVEAFEKGSSTAYFTQTVIISSRLAAGASAPVEVANVPVHLFPAGTTIRLALLVDADRDGRLPSQAAETTITIAAP